MRELKLCEVLPHSPFLSIPGNETARANFPLLLISLLRPHPFNEPGLLHHFISCHLFLLRQQEVKEQWGHRRATLSAFTL